MNPHFYFAFYLTEFPQCFKKTFPSLFIRTYTKSSALHTGALKASTPTRDHWQTKAGRDASSYRRICFAKRGLRGSTGRNTLTLRRVPVTVASLREAVCSGWWWRKGKQAAERKCGWDCQPQQISGSKRTGKGKDETARGEQSINHAG